MKSIIGTIAFVGMLFLIAWEWSESCKAIEQVRVNVSILAKNQEVLRRAHNMESNLHVDFMAEVKP